MKQERAHGRDFIFILMVFAGGALAYLLAVLPLLAAHGGLFFYYGDYNVQQVPFLIFAHRAVREGRFFWNPLVDLGGNMGGCFAFYLWGSPFFWLTIPFPESWLPYMTPFLMALKFGTAAATACAWIRTQTRTRRAAALGAFLYAFSGFQACNIVFQHFHDVTAFFPLYLLAFDRFALGAPGGSRLRLPRHKAEGDLAGRCFPVGQAIPAGRGNLCAHAGPGGDGHARARAFICLTALMSVINYYFFFGQVLFLLLYYFIRRGIPLLRTGEVARLAREGVRILLAGAAGLALAAVFLVQALSGIMGNTRLSKVLGGYGLVAYPDATTPLAILKSLFMVPDLVARGTLFTSDHIRNGSLAFYLPCFAMAGVFAFWQLRKKSWKKDLCLVLAVMAFVPALSAAFSAFNANFYARWYYMPVLLCACMTAEAVEEEECRAFTRGAVLSLACTAFFLALCFLPVQKDGSWSFTAICENRKLLVTEMKGTILGAAMLLAVLFLKRRCGPVFARRDGGAVFSCRGFWRLPADALVLAATLLCCVTSTMAVLHNGSSLISYTGFEKWKRQMLSERPVLETAPFSRVETDSTSTNYEMVWGYPTMHCFESTVHPSIFAWYRGIGMIRTVESTLPLERVGARAIMSVRYYIENNLVRPEKSYTDQGGMDGYDLANEENGYHVYETENWIPMGFSFDSYMTEGDYDQIANGVPSDRVLVKDLILSDEMAEKYGHLMERDMDTDPGEMPYWEFSLYCQDRRDSACTDFAFDKNGYHATARMERDNLLLFSVPYDRGFTATVDGEPAALERADYGLSAIFVPAGDHQICVRYRPPGLFPAAAISVLAAAALLADALLHALLKGADM